MSHVDFSVAGALSIHKIDFAPTNSITCHFQAVPLLKSRLPDKGRRYHKFSLLYTYLLGHYINKLAHREIKNNASLLTVKKKLTS
jgi:hypothetical protein